MPPCTASGRPDMKFKSTLVNKPMGEKSRTILQGNMTKDEVLLLSWSTVCKTVDFIQGKTYLISGIWGGEGLEIDQCDLVQRFKEVTIHQVIGLRKRYNQCDCQAGMTGCKYDPNFPRICYKTFATCIQKDTKKCNSFCKWKFGPGFWNCC